MNQFVLVGVAGFVEGLVIPIDKPSTTVGRSTSCDICLTDDQVSRRHAQLTLIPHPFQADRSLVLAEDLASRNGLCVDGSRIDATILDGGEQILVGRCVFRLERRAA